MIEAEALQARLGRALELALVDIVGADLGGQEDLAARHARSPDAFTHGFLIGVDGGRVDMPIAALQSPLDGLRALISPRGPSAEAEARDRVTSRLNIVHRHLFLRGSLFL